MSFDMNDAVFAALQRYVPQVNPLASASTDLGMSRTTLNQLTSPSILAGTGVFSEEDLAQLMASWMQERYSILDAEAREDYNDAVKEWEKDTAKELEKWEKDTAKALEDWQKENDSIRAEYAASPAPTIPTFIRNAYRDTPFDTYFKMVESGEIGGNKLSISYGLERSEEEWFEEFSGQGMSEDEAKALAKEYSGKSQKQIDIDAYGEPDVEIFLKDIQDFGNDYSNWVQKMEDWKRNRESQVRSLNSELAKLGDRPVAGDRPVGEPAPELKDFAAQFNTQKERQDFFDEIGLPGLALFPNPMEPYQFTADDILGEYPTAAEQALMRFGDDPDVRTLESKRVQVGQPVSDYAVADFSAVGAQAPTATRDDVAKDFLARQRARRTEGGQAYQEAQRERTRARLVADLLNSQMRESGRTPFSDAMSNLYGYGRSV